MALLTLLQFILILSSFFSAFEQDLTDLMVQLPRLPIDLPYVVLQSQDGRKPKLEIKIRPQVVENALNWLIEHNPWYSQYVINRENMEFYEKNPIITEDHLRTIVQDWEPSPEDNEPQFRTMGEKDVFHEEDLAGDFPIPDGCVMTEVPSNTNEKIIKESLATATGSRVPGTFPNVHPEPSVSSSQTNAEANSEESPADAPSDPSAPAPEELQDRPTIAWPRRAKAPLSEFEPGYFAKCFPHLFPDGLGDFLMPVSDKSLCVYLFFSRADRKKNWQPLMYAFIFILFIQPSNQRTGKNPVFAAWVKHCLAFHDRRFQTDATFAMVVANMLRRRTALTIGNLVAKNDAQDMTLKELQQSLDAGDTTLLNKLRYHSKVKKILVYKINIK